MQFIPRIPNNIRLERLFAACYAGAGLFSPPWTLSRIVLSVLTVCLISVDAAHAGQAAPVGGIRVVGAVFDAEGQSLAGATVAFRSRATGLVRYGVVSQPDGHFEVFVAPGVYVVEVRFVGFGTLRRNLEVATGEGVVRMGPLAVGQRALPGDDVIVTGERADDALAPVTVTNISATDLARQPDMKDLPVHLARQPSITYWSENGNAIGYSTLRMRGFDQRRIAVVINGIPQNDPEDFNVFWINFFDIQGATQDIQIQRGTTGSRFGSAGIGGAVSIRAMPYRPDFSTSVHVGAGSFGTQRYSASVNSGLIAGKIVAYGRVSRLTSDGYRDGSWTEFWRWFVGATRYGAHHTLTLQAYGGPQKDGLAFSGIPIEANTETIPDGFGGTIDRKFNFSAATRDTERFHQPHVELHHTWTPGDDWEVTQRLFGVLGIGHFDFGGTFRSANYLRLPESVVPGDGDPATGARNLPLFITRPDIQLTFRAALDQWQLGYMPSITRRGPGRTTTLSGEARLHRSLRWGRIQDAIGLPADVAADIVGSRADQRVYSFRGEKAIVSGGVSHRERLSADWALQADAQATWRQYRVYDEDFFGTDFTKRYVFVNPSVGVTYRPEQPLRGFLSLAVTQREPRLKSLYDGEEAGAGFVPQLGRVTPETVFDVELGGAWMANRHRLTTTFFFMDFHDEIVPTGELDQFGVARTTNADRSRHKGVELEGEALLGALGIPGVQSEIGGNLTLARHEFDDGTPIAGFPNTTANLHLTTERGGIRFTSQFSYVGEQEVEPRSPGGGDPAAGASTRRVPALDSYTVVNATLAWSPRVVPGVQLSVDVNNVLNRRILAFGNVGAVGPQYFPLATRHAFFSIRYN